ncbi:MAG: M1 family metallopeptidase [Deltaproteobacteria bacterium]|nr:M1 family metallopeptidase [Deltaproteobacteria bacterium]
MNRASIALLLAVSACATRAPAPTADVENAPKPSLRLSQNVKPKSAVLALRLDPKKDTTSGTATYALELARAESIVWINATDLTVTSATLGGQPAKVVPGDEDYVGIAPSSPIGPGAVTLQLDFTGKVDKERSRGVYRGDEGQDAYLFTFFEAIDARRAFPCFDEPGFKIPWTLALRVPKDDVALANSPSTGEHDEGDGTKTVQFAASKPMPSYLVAFGVGPFELLDGGTAGHFKTPFRVAVPRGRSGEAKYALQATPRVIGILEDYFGMPYPYEKLDVLVVPRYWGTMEHPGLVAVGQTLALIKPEDLTVARQQFYVNIGGHELGHYWFGDYVTMGWWDDTWLNEALGEWLDAKLTSTFDPSWNFMTDRLVETEGARDKDGLASAKSIQQPVDTKVAIESAFDGELTYMKGSSVLRMFEEWVGEDRWRAFIRSYLAAHAWGNATAGDFLSKMSESLSPRVADAFKTFLAQPGIPVVHAEVHCEVSPKLVLDQTRDKPLGQNVPDALWKIPVCWRTEAGRNCTLLESAHAEVPLASCPAWLVPNAGALGYYRSALPAAAAQKLLPHLDPAERAQLADDTVAQVRAGRLGLADALALVTPLAATGERHAISASLDILGELNPTELDDAHYARYAAFVEKTYAPRARALGWTPRAGESTDDALLRPMIVGLAAAVGEDPQLVSEAQKLADGWIRTRSGVNDDLVDVLLRVAARHGDAALFARILSTLQKPELERRDRSRLFMALGSFKQAALAQRALAQIPAFDLRESLSAGWAVATTRETRELAWTALQQGFDTWRPRMRDDEVQGLIALGGMACNAARRTQADGFFRERVKKIDGGPMTLENMLDAMDVCIANRARNEAAVRAFLAP